MKRFLSGSTFSANSADNGGAIFTQSTGTITDCTFSENIATTYGGGAIDTRGDLTINDSTFSANFAEGSVFGAGGGALVNIDGTLTVNDSTFTANSCAGDGGGIGNTGTLTVNDSTLSANIAFSTDPKGIGGSGGGGINNLATATLNGDIIAGNFNNLSSGGIPDDVAGEQSVDAANSANNLIGTGGSDGLMDGQNGNQVGVSLADVGLAPLGNYGGATQTMALLPGSFAIAEGVIQTTATTDQRGAVRPVGSASDVGAFQDEGYTLTPTNTPQSANVNTAFAQPLLVTLSENFANDPLPGATILFTAPMSGPSAALSSPSATDDNGQASVTATANNTPGGPYMVTATDAGTDTATFSLTNNPEPTVSFADASQSVNESAGTPLTVTVDLSAASNVDTTISLTFGGTAVRGFDYTASANSITILAGQTSGSITLTPIDKGYELSNPTVDIGFGALTNANAGAPASDTIAIQSDPEPTASFAVASQSVNEADGTFVVAVDLSAASSVATTIPFLLSGTAAAGVDYGNVIASPLVIPAGQTSGFITGALMSDPGPSKTLTLTLGAPTNATVAAPNADTLTITAPPPPPPLPQLPPVSVAYGPNGEVMEIVNSAGFLTQFANGVGVPLGNGGVRSASVAYVGDTQVLEVVGLNGILTQFINGVPTQLGDGGVQSASVTYWGDTQVLEVVGLNGVLTQFINGVPQQLGDGGVRSASVAYNGNTQVLEVVGLNNVLTQFTNGVPQQLGGAGVQSAGVTFNGNSEVLDIIFTDGDLYQFDAFGTHPLGMIS